MTGYEFGEILQNERKRQGITRKKLSEMTGFSTRAILYWETGKREISLKNADIVSKVLGMTLQIGYEQERSEGGA